MRSLLLLALLACPALAAEPKPGLEIRAKSVLEMTDYFEYLGGLAGQEEQGKQFAEMVKAFGGKKGVIEGIDLTKPIGAYAVFTPDMVDSQFVVMLPCTDEKAFVGLLKTRLSLDPEEEGQGVYKLTIPNVPPPVFFKLHEGYLCITILDAKHLKTLLDPKAFFAAKEDALIAVHLHIDRIPAEFRKVALAQLELKINDRVAKMKDGDAGERLGHYLATEGGMKAAACVLNEGKTLSLKFNVVPKSDDLTLTATMTAKDGSDFEKILKSLANKPATAALAANAEHPVISVLLNAGAPDSMKKALADKIDEGINEAVKKAGGDREAVEKIFDAFAPTLKAGDYELGVAITGTPAGGKLKLVGAAKATSGKEIEKLAKEFASFIPEDKAKFEFDRAKFTGGNLHKVTVLNDDLKRLYGSETVWAGISENLYVIGFEEKGDETARIANLKPGTSPMLAAKLAAARFLPLTDPSIDSKMVAEASDEVFGGPAKPGADEIALTVTGGKELTIALTAKGKAIAFMAKIDAKKKAK